MNVEIDNYTNAHQEFIPPQPQSDFMETDIADYSASDAVDRRATRWVVYSGDNTVPEFKRTFQGMKLGGEYLGQDYKTMNLTKGLLRRCQLTPMTIGYDYLNADSLGDDKSRARSRSAYDPETRSNYTIYYHEILPGDEIASLLTSSQGANDWGVREIECLRDVAPPKLQNGQFTASKGRDYQLAIFPDWNEFVSGQKAFFRTTTELENYLRVRKNELSGEILEVIDILIESSQAFERWATSKLDDHSRLVKAPPTAEGKTYGWENIHAQWFEQLGLNREEFLMKKSEPPIATNEVSREEFNEMRGIFAQVMPAIGKLAEMAVAAAPTAPVTEEPKATFAVGDTVQVGKRTGNVIKKPFGRFTVKFSDNTEETFNAEDLSKLEEI